MIFIVLNIFVLSLTSRCFFIDTHSEIFPPFFSQFHTSYLLSKILRVKQNNLAGLGDLAENTVRFHFHINM